RKLDVHSKTFFPVMACCALALGAIAWVGVAELRSTRSDDTTTAPASQAQDEADEVRAEVSNVERDTTTTTTTQPEEETELSSMPAGENNIPYKSSYHYPISEEILKEYSDGNLVYSETLGDYRSHNGTDFNGSDGDAIYSINDGLVLSVSEDSLWGTVVEIDHGHKLVAKYCGFRSVNVTEGELVEGGQILGTLGVIPIESSDGAHLHLEIRIDGELVNPLEAMNKVDSTESE
ncbi:MAG: M23 family metallopeptidase, partial [Clostridiales bacterium]|nr:M23 family metallopeptidase [Clostridiales bacterium]